MSYLLYYFINYRKNITGDNYEKRLNKMNMCVHKKRLKKKKKEISVLKDRIKDRIILQIRLK